MLPLILVALLAQRSRLTRVRHRCLVVPRSAGGAADSRSAAPAPEVTRARDAAVLSGLVAAVGAPLVLGESRTGFATLVLVYAMVGLSVVVLSGWADRSRSASSASPASGRSSPEHGDAAARGLLRHADRRGRGRSLVALLIGLPALRVPGLFLAVVTLAFGAFVQFVALNRDLAGALLPPDGR